MITRQIILLFLFLGLLNPFRLEAGGLSFNVDPSKIRLIIAPAGSQVGTIKVTSQSTDKIKIKVYLEDWVYTKVQDGTKDFFPAKNTSLSGSDWITFNPAEFTLLPFGTQIVNYVARIPAEAKGGHYSVLFFETAFVNEPEYSESTQSDEVRTGAVLNIRLGALFYLEAKDTVKRAAELSNLSLSKDVKNKRLNIACDLKNTGNVDITASGSFHIIDSKGMVLAREEFNQIYTLPGDTAKLTSSWKEIIPEGEYDLILSIDLGKALEELSMGRGPLITKEAEIEIGDRGEIVKVGELR